MINLLVFAPSNDHSYHVPAGFIFADEVFAESGLRDRASASQGALGDLQRNLIYLLYRFPGRLRVRWVDPWSPRGLVYTLRYRLRTFPSILIRTKGEKQILRGKEIGQINEHVIAALSKPSNS